jgi:outer membrane lipoprotein-sorting protein
MNTDRKTEKLDELISRAISREAPKFEFDKWKQSHKEEIQIYDSQTAGQKPPRSVRIFETGRMIMKSRTSKIAAAAVIIIAVLAATHFLGHPIESVAWADVVRPILTARTVVFNVIPAEGENVPITRAMNMGSQRVRTELLSPDGKNVQVIAIIDYDTSRILQLIPGQKTAIFIELKDIPEEEKPENILEEMRNIITELQNNPDVSIESLGEKEIDGRIAKGFRAIDPDGEVTVWADPETALPIRMEQTWRQMQFVFTDFQFDVEMDESLFSMEIPEGYSEPVQGELSIEGSTEEDLLKTLRIWAEVILDGVFPRDLTGQVYLEDVKRNRQKFVNLEDKEKIELAMKLQPGYIFVQLLKAENDWNYVGGDVKLGDADSPVCWYRPKDSETYRVIYGDLSVKDVAPEDLPK